MRKKEKYRASLKWIHQIHLTMTYIHENKQTKEKQQQKTMPIHFFKIHTRLSITISPNVSPLLIYSISFLT